MTKETDDLLTPNALARLMNLDRATVERRLRGTAPTSTKVSGKRTFRYYSLAEVRELLEAPNDAQQIAAARERLATVRADLIAIKRARRRNDFVDVGQATDEFASAVTVSRNRFLGITAKLGPQLMEIMERNGVSKERQAAMREVIERELLEIETDLLTFTINERAS